MEIIELNDSTAHITEDTTKVGTFIPTKVGTFMADKHIKGAWYASEIHNPQQLDARICVHTGRTWTNALRKVDDLYNELFGIIINFESNKGAVVYVEDNKIVGIGFKKTETAESNEKVNLNYDKISNYGIF